MAGSGPRRWRLLIVLVSFCWNKRAGQLAKDNTHVSSGSKSQALGTKPQTQAAFPTQSPQGQPFPPFFPLPEGLALSGSWSPPCLPPPAASQGTAPSGPSYRLSQEAPGPHRATQQCRTASLTESHLQSPCVPGSAESARGHLRGDTALPSTYT